METPTTGTVLQEGSPIVFGSTLAKGPSHYANLGFGGYHQVDTLAERNAIPAERRPEGLPCYVRETGLAYVLEGGITNAHWQAMPGPAAIAAKADATALSAQVTKQAGDLLSRDTMLGVNGRHLPFIIAASSDLKPRSLDAHPGSIPRPSGVVAASQSGTTVTCSDSSYVFSYQEIGRRIVWADGSDAVIVAVPSDASPVLVVTVDRSQTVAAQPFRVQASGICGVVEGDSTAYSNKTDLRAILYRQWGYGGAFISAASDTTIGDYETTTLSAGVTVLTTAFDCAPAGFAWLVPVGESVIGGINAKYRDGQTDEAQIFDIPQKDRKTNCVTVMVKRKAGATYRVEARLREDAAQTDGWTVLADNVDANAGSEYISYITIPHAMGVCWNYRVTVLTDTGGGGLTVVGIYTENREKPGFVWICWDTGGSSMANFSTMEESALRVINRITRITFRCVEYRDYNKNPDGTDGGQNPGMPAQLGPWRAKWVSAGCRCDHIYFGGYPNSGNSVTDEAQLYRGFCLSTGDTYIDQRALYQYYSEAFGTGTMLDSVHANGKGARTMGTIIAQHWGILDLPWSNSGRDVDAPTVSGTRVLAGGEDVALAIEAAKAGPWANGVFNRSASGYAAWATVPAPGVTGFAVQIWIEIPKTNPSSPIPLFGFYATESVSVAAGNVDCNIDVAGRLVVSFRNIANNGYATYRLGGSVKTPGDFIREFGGRRGCLTVIVDPAKKHPQAYFGVERVNDKCVPTYAPTTGMTVERITDPVNIPGVNFNVGITPTHYARQIAYWTGGPLPTWDGELKRNAERGSVGGLGATPPAAHWVASTGAGRYIRDISGNGRHVKLGGSSPTGVNGRNNPGDGLTLGFAWLEPRPVRTTFVMTTNAGMVPMYGEDIYVDISAGAEAVISLPAIANPDGGEIRIWGKGPYLPKIAQQGAATQIVTGLGTTDGLDRSTAGTTGYLKMGQRYTCLSLKALTADLWTTPSLPPGATLAVATSVTAALEASSITGARMAGLMGGGVQSFGDPYAPWTVGPALGTGGFTLSWTGLVPKTFPATFLRMCRTSTNRSGSNSANSLDVGFTSASGGRLSVQVRNSANTGGRYWYLNNFSANYGGRLCRITVKFDPAAASPEVWVEGSRIDGTGNMTWVEQDTGTAPYPTMADANFTGTNIMAGCDSPCYQFALWSGLLPSTEIAENQIAGRWVSATVPICYYEFAEGAGRTSADLSGNNRPVQFLHSGGVNGNDSGNGITTGVRWLRRRRRSVFTTTTNNAITLRPGERFVATAPTVRAPCTLDPLVELDGEDITVENVGAAGFLITLPAGHRAVMGAGVTVGTDATSAGGTITSNQLYAVCVLRPLIVNSSTDVTWRLVTASGVTLA